MLVHFILSVLFGVSFAVLLVEKGEDWPVTFITKPLRFLLSLINEKLGLLLDCTICTSFWATLIGEIVLWKFITYQFYWPFSGIMAVGLSWFMIEFLNAIDRNSRNS